MNSAEANACEIAIFNTTYDDSQTEPLTSTKFWKGFLQFRIEGYDRFIKFFGPKLQEYEQLLQRFKEPEERNWVESIEIEVEKEMAQLELFKDYRETFGKMSTEITEFQTKAKKDENDLTKLKNELKVIQDEVRKLEEKQIEEEMKMASRIERMENYILSLSPKKEEKANLLRKYVRKYDKRDKTLQAKMVELTKKSDQVFDKYMQHEREKLGTILQGWETTLTSLNSIEDPEYDETDENGPTVPGSFVGVNTEEIINKILTNHRTTFDAQITMTTQQLLRNNPTCRDFFKDIIQESGEQLRTEIRRHLSMPPASSTTTKDENVRHLPMPPAATATTKNDPKNHVQTTTNVLDFNAADSSDEDEPVLAKPMQAWTSIDHEQRSQTMTPPLNEQVGHTRYPNYLDHRKHLENQEDSFETFKTKIIMTYKKEKDNEMSVRKGERVRILDRADNSYVLAKKRTRLRKVKVGLIPIWTIGKVV